MGIEGHRHRGLGWPRVHRRAGAAIALLAMVLQLVGLFGHVHLREGRAAAFAPKKAVVAASVAVQNVSLDHATLPASDADAWCAICLVGHLASAATEVSAPVLPVPVAHQQRAPRPRLAPAGSRDPRPFWSQGPPAV
jgi:hypothetical protein